MDYVTNFEESENIEVCFTFSQPPRQWYSQQNCDEYAEDFAVGVPFRAALEEMEETQFLIVESSRAMAKRQVKLVQDGANNLKLQETALRACIAKYTEKGA